MKTYQKSQNCSKILLQKCNKEIWQELMNAQDRNKDFKAQKVQGAVLKEEHLPFAKSQIA